MGQVDEMRWAGTDKPESGALGRVAARWLVGSSAVVLGAGLAGPTLAAQHYVVRPGDFLVRIAAREGVSARQLIAANHLAAPYRVYPGETLVLRRHVSAGRLHWTEAAYQRPHAGAGHYRIRSGDWLLRIARVEGVSLERLAHANRIERPYHVYAGEVLTIPGRAGGVAIAQVRPHLAAAPPAPAENEPLGGTVSIEPQTQADAAQTAEVDTQPVSVVLPLYADETHLGDVHAYIDPDGIVSVDASQFGDLIRKVLAEPRYARVETLLARKQVIQIVSIDNSGVIATYDGARGRINLDIQPEDRLAEAAGPASRPVTAIGQLVDAGGTPVSLRAGKATLEGHPARAPVVLFTTRDGRFAASGLAPGRWRIEMQAEPRVFEITVPGGGEALVRLGVIGPA